MTSAPRGYSALTLALISCALIATACVGRSFQPEATRVRPIITAVATPDGAPASLPPDPPPLPIDCMIPDGHDDKHVQGAAMTPADLFGVDINLDGRVDEDDVAALRDLDIPLDSHCIGETHYILHPAAAPPDCDGGPPFLLVVGITGSADHGLKDTDPAGIAALTAELRADLEKRGYAVASAVAAPDIQTAKQKEAAMESWLELVLRGVFRKHSCARAVLVGHSYGATSALAVSAWLEREGFGPRVAFAALIDRVTFKYDGDADAAPQEVPVFHVYETDADQTRCARTAGVPNPEGVRLAERRSVVQLPLTDYGYCHFDIATAAAVHGIIVGYVGSNLAPP